ncbi:MAG: hypothetical protein AUJ92_02515 [Armatimonadetes bacterium CG2_30_59_28]|nr:hypothetical protein [Armatimonadota bacterium]OIO97958.1 MAG: hypothetical protein AUJ92_02515 [Armatimonadetes bacterium CG2_30_59_28]PIU63539.1 MAG: hypothetical protein COS85_15665 [Armatimonadetes bacterium CG07_land_8_20_14_0_80_59_28]PIX40549.1 MAG: hypothetical protein COZ56_14450 [Armatimonadetes bacterium CG_4_8_14_3_um_filter_58_9]PIY48505.1 MAG: hypothetical protein COZ05_02930 [Armatimonadetes bacterium CG_4_10_14_3_um_filter_59_10]PJB61950.1 MAG: hypothetical protein CO095_196
MKIRSLKLKNRDYGNEWSEGIEDRWDYADFLADPHWKMDWISFDGVVYHAGTDRVYCGITSFAADIFQLFDRRENRFVDLGFSRVADPYDAKFHRSMELTRDGSTLYTATALLHDVDRYWDAPGGGIFRHNIATGQTDKLGIPLPHNYIQSIALDEERGVIYSMHLTPERLSVFDLETCKSRDLGPIGSGLAMAQGENIVLDDDGCVWCGWGLTRAWQSNPGGDSFRLCKFDPAKGRIEYLEIGLPRRDGGYGFAKVEGLFNLGTGCLHASGDNGSLYRIDTATGQAAYIGTPIPDRRSRLASLALNTDGFAYGITGRDGQCQLLRFDPKTETFDVGDSIVEEDGNSMWQCHDVTITPDGVLYAGENDNPHRSGYLWEVDL